MSNELAQQLVAWRRDLHQHPELSNEEFATTDKIKSWLHQANIRLVDLPLKTGVVAEIGNSEGPLIALRADIDALPIAESTHLPFSSVHAGKMHACGHDFHTSVMLGAAHLLKARESTLPGRVRVFFQPAEETFNGAEQLISAGALKGVQAIFGLHNAPELPVGTFGTRSGALNANVDRFEIIIRGKGAHAAKPEEGIDTIVTAAHIITALQTLPSRNYSALQSLVLSVTRVSGGNTWNVLPEKVELEGTVRTHDNEIRRSVPERITQLINGIANAVGAEAELIWYPGPPVVINTAHWADFSKQVAAEFGYDVQDIPPQMGGEDFAFYLHHVPGAFVNIGSASPFGLHHPRFNLNEDAIYPAAQYFHLLADRALRQLADQ
jgi:amidohydrolase